MSFSTASRVSFVFIIFLVASVVVCMCVICVLFSCICIPILVLYFRKNIYIHTVINSNNLFHQFFNF